MTKLKKYPKLNYLLNNVIKAQKETTPDAEYNPRFVVDEEYWPTFLNAVELEKSLQHVNLKVLDAYAFGEITQANKLIEIHSLQNVNVFMHVLSDSEVLKNFLFDY